MITALDTSVLVDVFSADATFGPRSAAMLRASIGDGPLIACAVVWAEVVAGFNDAADAEEALRRLGVTYATIDQPTAAAAGSAWRSYRRAGGRRSRVIADFLIGAHALHHADRLLTRDRGFYRSYFEHLTVLDPAAN